MPSLIDALGQDLKDAMRAGDALRRDEIRGLLAMLKGEIQTKLTRGLSRAGLILHGDDAVLTPAQQAAVDQLRATAALTHDEEQAVLLQRVKQHRQSIEGFQKGGRADLSAIEEAQLAVLERYLPRPLSADEVEQAIRDVIAETGASGPRDQGKVMSALSPRLRGRADMRAVSGRVQTLLAAG